MKRIALIPVAILCLLVFSACESGRTCSATVIDFVFKDDALMGYKAVSVLLETSDGEAITLNFADIPAEKRIIEGSLEISAGAEGKTLVSYDGYTQTFVLKDGTEVIFTIGSQVFVREKQDGMWVLAI